MKFFLSESDSRFKDTRLLFCAYLYRWLAHSTHFSGNLNSDLIIIKLKLAFIPN